ncbi:MAG: pseudouridine synthase [Oceanospirillaceae bacterium]|nr:pseudouridine synthase [Oceanospirillaceae bacterium]
MANLILLNKPFQVLSQFTDDGDRNTLKHFISDKGFYPAGRLDYDSEGLLILTDDGPTQHQLANPAFKLEKTYWAQVEGELDQPALDKLIKGVVLKDGLTKPASARIIPEPDIWDRTPPIRERQNKPTSWLELKIKEGKNRQVRRMTAAVGFPTLRLIRYAIGNWTVDNLAPGETSRETVQLTHKPKTGSNKDSQRHPSRRSKYHTEENSVSGRRLANNRSRTKK